MNAGRLRTKVTIQKLKSITDDDGFESETWEDYYTNYADADQLYGTERWNAAQVNMDQAIRFTFRHHSQLDEVQPKYYRIVWKERIFTISFVDNPHYRNEEVRIDALEVRA